MLRLRLARSGFSASLVFPAILVSCVLLQSGCAGVPGGGPAAVPPVVTQQQGVPPQTQGPRRGGYYQDDGPGENSPPDLGAIADAEPRLDPLHRFANNPYNVFGQAYVPLRSASPYRQRGLGSWYGRKFHGQRTSSGEPYDMYAMTAAHPTLPIPSYARVTHVASGRTVVVRINDRGPFHSGRIIDLSYTAAWKLGYVAAGSAQVDVEAISPAEIAERGKKPVTLAVSAASYPAAQAQPVTKVLAAEQKPLPPLAEKDGAVLDSGDAAQSASRGGTSGNVYLQLAAFSARESAEQVRVRLGRELAWLGRTIEIFSKGGLFRLHLGPYRDRSEAGGVAARIQEAMQTKPMIVVR
ncbi:MAG: septal ring lytic transglycosylase RlpA family protein [Betaproteobacteria bacterium]|nr:septal ring lytic transglycosylase RlpA family protein [Betaproteobacteria bacterium]